MGAEYTHFLKLLFPHIQSALNIRQALGIAWQRASDAEAMVDASTTPTFLLSGEGEILHANQAAHKLLREGDGLLSRQGFLVASKSGMRKPLQDLLQDMHLEVGTFTGFHPAKPLSLERISGRRPLQLLASPIPKRGNYGVLLLATDPEKPVVLRDDVLQEHYRFTPAETEVANGLLTGYSLEEIAVLRKVKIGTVRDQVKSILAKTGTGRQSELVKLLLSLPQLA